LPALDAGLAEITTDCERGTSGQHGWLEACRGVELRREHLGHSIALRTALIMSSLLENYRI
jgi:hypothetical protein